MKGLKEIHPIDSRAGSEHSKTLWAFLIPSITHVRLIINELQSICNSACKRHLNVSISLTSISNYCSNFVHLHLLSWCSCQNAARLCRCFGRLSPCRCLYGHHLPTYPLPDSCNLGPEEQAGSIHIHASQPWSGFTLTSTKASSLHHWGSDQPSYDTGVY